MRPTKLRYQETISSYHRGEYASAYPLILKYAEKGNPEACAIIATYHQAGLGGVRIDETVAVKLYTYASAEGYAVASNNLGTIALMRGDRTAAREWYEKAREQGFPHSPTFAKTRRSDKDSKSHCSASRPL